MPSNTIQGKPMDKKTCQESRHDNPETIRDLQVTVQNREAPPSHKTTQFSCSQANGAFTKYYASPNPKMSDVTNIDSNLKKYPPLADRSIEKTMTNELMDSLEATFDSRNPKILQRLILFEALCELIKEKELIVNENYFDSWETNVHEKRSYCAPVIDDKLLTAHLDAGLVKSKEDVCSNGYIPEENCAEKDFGEVNEAQELQFKAQGRVLHMKEIFSTELFQNEDEGEQTEQVSSLDMKQMSDDGDIMRPHFFEEDSEINLGEMNQDLSTNSSQINPLSFSAEISEASSNVSAVITLGEASTVLSANTEMDAYTYDKVRISKQLSFKNHAGSDTNYYFEKRLKEDCVFSTQDVIEIIPKETVETYVMSPFENYDETDSGTETPTLENFDENKMQNNHTVGSRCETFSLNFEKLELERVEADDKYVTAQLRSDEGNESESSIDSLDSLESSPEEVVEFKVEKAMEAVDEKIKATSEEDRNEITEESADDSSTEHVSVGRNKAHQRYHARRNHVKRKPPRENFQYDWKKRVKGTRRQKTKKIDMKKCKAEKTVSWYERILRKPKAIF